MGLQAHDCGAQNQGRISARNFGAISAHMLGISGTNSETISGKVLLHFGQLKRFTGYSCMTVLGQPNPCPVRLSVVLLTPSGMSRRISDSSLFLCSVTPCTTCRVSMDASTNLWNEIAHCARSKCANIASKAPQGSPKLPKSAPRVSNGGTRHAN